MRTLTLALAFTASALMAAERGGTEPARPAYRLQWNDLDRLVRGRRVSLKLPSGIRLAGNVVSIEPDALVLDVRKTSDKRSYPKGPATVPRAEVTRLRINQGKGYNWRAAGTAIGAGAGIAVAAPVVAYVHNESGRSMAAVAAAIVAVPAALGYLAGWTADRKMIDVIVEPSGGPPPSL